MLTKGEKDDLERVQKVARKLILRSDYKTYKQALADLNLEDLESRRQRLAKKIGMKSLNNPKMHSLFKVNPNININTRNREKYEVKFAHTERMRKSPVIAIQIYFNMT